MKKYCLCIIIIISFLFTACHSSDDRSKPNIYKVTHKKMDHSLFYSGSIQPIRTTVVQTKTEGMIINMAKQYGEVVKQNELLFVVSSSKFLNDYKSALLQYIKAKNEFHQSETQLHEVTFLHKNALISDDEFKLKQSSYYANQLAFIQAKDALRLFLTQMNVPEERLFNLSIADIEKVKEAMHLTHHAENLQILAPINGVLLAPSKSDDENRKIRQGEACKEGEVLAVIGDLSGFAVRVKANESAINHLRVGQMVKVTGVAFPDHTLIGHISHLDRQGESVGSGQPTFSVDIEVKTLTEKERKLIHVGMSANVQIQLTSESEIMVPNNAIKEVGDELIVDKWDEKKKRFVKTSIKTGKSNLDYVVVLSGLQEGDHIVLPD